MTNPGYIEDELNNLLAEGNVDEGAMGSLSIGARNDGLSGILSMDKSDSSLSDIPEEGDDDNSLPPTPTPSSRTKTKKPKTKKLFGAALIAKEKKDAKTKEAEEALEKAEEALEKAEEQERALAKMTAAQETLVAMKATEDALARVKASEKRNSLKRKELKAALHNLKNGIVPKDRAGRPLGQANADALARKGSGILESEEVTHISSEDDMIVIPRTKKRGAMSEAVIGKSDDDEKTVVSTPKKKQIRSAEGKSARTPTTKERLYTTEKFVGWDPDENYDLDEITAFKSYGQFSEYPLVFGCMILDLEDVPNTARLDDWLLGRMACEDSISRKDKNKRWPAEFDTNGMIRATRMPLGHPYKVYKMAGEVDSFGVEAAEDGWYYGWYRGLQLLCGKEGYDAGVFKIRPSFEKLIDTHMGWRATHMAVVQLKDDCETSGCPEKFVEDPEEPEDTDVQTAITHAKESLASDHAVTEE